MKIKHNHSYLYMDRQTAEWSSHMGNNANTYSVPDSLPINVTQQNSPLKYFFNPLVTSNGTYYAIELTNSNSIYAVNIASNTQKWQYSLVGGPTTIYYLIAKDNYVFLLTDTGLIALEDTGSAPAVKWTKNEKAVRFNYDDTKLYYVTIGSNKLPYVVVIDLSTGNELKRFSIADYNDFVGSITVGGGKIYVTVSNNIYTYFKIYAADPSTGKVLWVYNLGDYQYPSSLITEYLDGKLYLDYGIYGTTMYTYKFFIISIDALTGKKIWNFNVGDEFTHSGILNRFTVVGNSVLTLISTGYLIAIDKNTGSERWRVKYIDSNIPASQPIDTSSSGLLIGAGDKAILNNGMKVKIFDINSGSLLRAFTPSIDVKFYPVAVSENTLFLTGKNGVATYMQPLAGSDTTKPTININSFGPLRISPYESTSSKEQFEIWLSEEAYIKLYIKDINNQTIRQIDFGIVEPGWGYLYWDGRDSQGKPAPYGKYHFAIQLTDLAGNTNSYEYPDKIVTVGDTTAIALTDIDLRSGPGLQYSSIKVILAGNTMSIIDVSNDWINVNYENSVTGYVLKKNVSTYSNPVLVSVITSTTNYTVQAGDSLYKIATKLGSTVDIIISANSLTNPNALYVGQKLQIPVISQKPVGTIHSVVSGDALWKISSLYKVPIYLIIKNNDLVYPYNLSIGQKLLIN